MRKTQALSLEEGIQQLLRLSEKESLKIGDILKVLESKGQIMLVLFLTLPFCQPIQIPGFSTPFGILIAVIGIQIALGKMTWLPEKLLNKTIESETLKKIADKSLALLASGKRFIHPRWILWVRSPLTLMFSGFLIFILGILLALPLPIPFSNLLVAWSLFFIGLGTLEDDGVFLAIGYLLAAITIIVFAILGFSLTYFVWDWALSHF